MREAVKKNFINVNKPKILMDFNRNELLCKMNSRQESSYIIQTFQELLSLMEWNFF